METGRIQRTSPLPTLGSRLPTVSQLEPELLDSADREDALGLIDRWTAGVYFEDFEETTQFGGFGDFETEYETQTLSAYGQATHFISEETRLTPGYAPSISISKPKSITPIPLLSDDPQFDDWLFGGKITLEHDLVEIQPQSSCQQLEATRPAGQTSTLNSQPTCPQTTTQKTSGILS